MNHGTIVGKLTILVQIELCKKKVNGSLKHVEDEGTSVIRMLIEPNFIFGRHIFRYHATLLRARFDQNKNMTDLSKARALVVAGERENFEKAHPIPKKCKSAPPSMTTKW